MRISDWSSDVCSSDLFDTPDGTGVRDFIHVSDLAEAHVLALEHLERGGQSVTLNCGYGHGASGLQVVATVEAITGRRQIGRASSRESMCQEVSFSLVAGTLKNKTTNITLYNPT